MIKAILKLLTLPWRRKKDSIGDLYYLYGIKPINSDKRIIDECTVTK